MKDISPTSAVKNAAGENNSWNAGSHLSVRWVMQFTLFIAIFAVLCMFLFISSITFRTPTFSRHLAVGSKEVTLSLSFPFFSKLCCFLHWSWKIGAEKWNELSCEPIKQLKNLEFWVLMFIYVLMGLLNIFLRNLRSWKGPFCYKDVYLFRYIYPY